MRLLMAASLIVGLFVTNVTQATDRKPLIKFWNESCLNNPAIAIRGAATSVDDPRLGAKCQAVQENLKEIGWCYGPLRYQKYEKDGMSWHVCHDRD
jgi:hypothetical protein